MPSRVKVKTARAVFAPGQRRSDGILCWLFALYRVSILCWLFALYRASILCWVFILMREEMVVEKSRKQMERKQRWRYIDMVEEEKIVVGKW